MAHPLSPGEAAGRKAFFLSGLLPLQVEWPFYSLWASFSTAPTPVLVPPDRKPLMELRKPTGLYPGGFFDATTLRRLLPDDKRLDAVEGAIPIGKMLHASFNRR